MRGCELVEVECSRGSEKVREKVCRRVCEGRRVGKRVR